MPFKSEAQRRFLFWKYPKIAHKWAEEEKKLKAAKTKRSLRLEHLRMFSTKKAKKKLKVIF